MRGEKGATAYGCTHSGTSAPPSRRRRPAQLTKTPGRARGTRSASFRPSRQTGAIVQGSGDHQRAVTTARVALHPSSMTEQGVSRSPSRASRQRRITAHPRGAHLHRGGPYPGGMRRCRPPGSRSRRRPAGRRDQRRSLAPGPLGVCRGRELAQGCGCAGEESATSPATDGGLVNANSSSKLAVISAARSLN